LTPGAVLITFALIAVAATSTAATSAAISTAASRGAHSADEGETSSALVGTDGDAIAIVIWRLASTAPTIIDTGHRGRAGIGTIIKTPPECDASPRNWAPNDHVIYARLSKDHTAAVGNLNTILRITVVGETNRRRCNWAEQRIDARKTGIDIVTDSCSIDVGPIVDRRGYCIANQVITFERVR
jgi:hypothetical protein